MRKSILVLGVLSAALVAAVGPTRASTTSTTWELYAFAAVDGTIAEQKKILRTPFFTAQDCIAYALTLPPPPPSKVINGHTVTAGYTCVKVEVNGQEAQR